MFFADFGNDTIGKVDAKTGEPTFYTTPTKMSRPRRGHMDAQDRFWFAEFNGNAVGMLDATSGKISEWQVPTPWTAPYDAILDKNNEVWTGGMDTDRVVRLNPQTGQSVEYPMPDDANIRRVFVDKSHQPGHVLDWQQPRCGNLEGRAAGLNARRLQPQREWMGMQHVRNATRSAARRA